MTDPAQRGNGWRYCLTCNRNRNHAYRYANIERERERDRVRHRITDVNAALGDD